MKKIIINLATVAIFYVVIPGNINAQNLKDYSYSVIAKNTGNDFANTQNSSITGPVTKAGIVSMKAELKAARANYRATENFNKQFKNISNVNWMADNNAIVATFSNADGMFSRVVYDKAGKWLYTVLNYLEKDAPEDVNSLMKNNFKAYTIKLVQEVMQGDVKLYKVHLENDHKIKQVLVCDGVVTEYEEFTKAR